MIGSLISGILGIAIWLLRLVSLAVLVYCVLSFVAPGGKIFTTMKRYVEPVLAPFRELLRKYLPAVGNLAFDFSPIAVILVIEVVVLVLRLLQAIF